MCIRDRQQTDLTVLRGRRLLLAEDNALNMEIMEFLLNDVGIKVTKAADGQQAVEAFAASLLAVIPLTLLARILAMTLRAPVTVFLLTGIFPLVPGAGIYYSAYYFIQGDNALALANGISTFTFVVRSSRTRSFSSMMHAMYQLNSFATLPMTVLSALLPASPSSSARTSLTVSCSTSSVSTAFS